MSGSFKDVTNEPVGYKSFNFDKGAAEDKECQTLEVANHDEGIQSSYTINTEVQTEVVKTFENVSYNENKLAGFLSKITPSLLKELDKAERCKAFSSRSPDTEDSWEVKERFSLNYLNAEVDDGLEVSAMSWSCTGSTIAVGCGHKKHIGWCTHRSHVRFYNIDRPGFHGSEPHQLVETVSCVTALSMHPFEPSVIAVGTYSGEVLVWNLNRGDNHNLDNSIHHTDCVTQLSWAILNSQPLLVSSSLDGHMFIFKVVPQIGSIILSDRYLLGECIIDLQQYPGVRCFSFSPTQEGVFIAGSECGTVFQCSILAASPKIRYGDGAEVKDPTVQRVKVGNAPVTSVAFSPYEDTLYVVSTADKKIDLYSLKNSELLLTAWCNFEVWGAVWSPSQANIIMSWGSSGCIAVYESSTGQHLGILQPEKCEDLKSIIVISLNRKSSRLAAVISLDGKCKIWEIPTYFKNK